MGREEAGVATGRRLRGAGNWAIGNPWVFILVAAFAGFVVWAAGTRSQPHDVRAVFDEGVSLYSGLDVRVDGIDAGKIKTVENVDGKAVVTLGIKDDQIWPLHRGTKATLRFGSTIGNGTRIVDLDPGPANAPEIPDNGIIRDADTIETTEFDDVFDTFDKKTQKALQGTLKGTGDTFGPRKQELRSAVEETPDGLEAVGNLANDIDADEPALRAFIQNTDRVTSALATRRDQVSSLVGVASATFDTFAANTNGIKDSLDRFPPTVREARTTLSRLDESVAGVQQLVDDVRPGAKELGRLSVELRPALANLKKTVPVAVSTFQTARRAAPDITTLLKESQPFSDKAAPVLTTAAPMIGCIRPYAPEIAGVFSTWSSWGQPTDDRSHLGRIWGNVGLTSVIGNPLTPSAYSGASGQGYALVRPPGYNAGKTWFQPQCGADESGLDPSKDPDPINAGKGQG